MKTSRTLVLVLALMAGIPAANFIVGCSEDKSSNPIESVAPAMDNTVTPADSVEGRKDAQPAALTVDWNSEKMYTGNWAPYVFSEVKYALSPGRTGTSTVSYNGLALSNWDYVASDWWAYNQVAAVNGSPGLVGTTTLAGSVPANATVGRGGWCKFFASLVLFRSSYGIGGGYHLILPSGYNYATQSVTVAQPGWVIQNPGYRNASGELVGMHTAIVVANLGSGLDVIDANYTGGNGKYIISRHPFSWAQLASYRAYKPVRMLRFY